MVMIRRLLVTWSINDSQVHDCASQTKWCSPLCYEWSKVVIGSPIKMKFSKIATNRKLCAKWYCKWLQVGVSLSCKWWGWWGYTRQTIVNSWRGTWWRKRVWPGRTVLAGLERNSEVRGVAGREGERLVGRLNRGSPQCLSALILHSVRSHGQTNRPRRNKGRG